MQFIPSLLIEATNGTIMVLLAYFLFFMAMHFRTEWRRVRHLYGGRRGALRTILRLRDDCSPEVALTAIMLGFEMRTVILWAARHSENHQHNLVWLEFNGTAMLIAGTALVIVGAICWNRVMAPFYCSPWVWFAMAVSAGMFGVGMAFY